MDCRICGDPNSAMRFAFIEFAEDEGAKRVRTPRGLRPAGRTRGIVAMAFVSAFRAGGGAHTTPLDTHRAMHRRPKHLGCLFSPTGWAAPCRFCMLFLIAGVFSRPWLRLPPSQAIGKTGEVLGRSPLRVLPSKTAIVPVNRELMPRTDDELERCSRTVYVANIDKKVDKRDVRNFFEQLCGERPPQAAAAGAAGLESGVGRMRRCSLLACQLNAQRCGHQQFAAMRCNDALFSPHTRTCARHCDQDPAAG